VTDGPGEGGARLRRDARSGAGVPPPPWAPDRDRTRAGTMPPPCVPDRDRTRAGTMPPPRVPDRDRSGAGAMTAARTPRRWIAAWVIATAAGLAAAVPRDPARAEPPIARAKAPAFSVRSVAGERLELAALLAKGPVVLDFWATWCKPCLQSLPELETLHRRYAARGVSVVGVSIDGPRNFAKVRPFANRLGLSFAVALDEGERLQQLYQVRAVPTSVLIGRDGEILHVKQGFLPGDSRLLEQAIAAALGDTAEAAAP
jgi:peroxiredoxin